eukprot:2449371-Pyramimonas_sp.AAC.1
MTDINKTEKKRRRRIPHSLADAALQRAPGALDSKSSRMVAARAPADQCAPTTRLLGRTAGANEG